MRRAKKHRTDRSASSFAVAASRPLRVCLGPSAAVDRGLRPPSIAAYGRRRRLRWQPPLISTAGRDRGLRPPSIAAFGRIDHGLQPPSIAAFGRHRSRPSAAVDRGLRPPSVMASGCRRSRPHATRGTKQPSRRCSRTSAAINRAVHLRFKPGSWDKCYGGALSDNIVLKGTLSMLLVCCVVPICPFAKLVLIHHANRGAPLRVRVSFPDNRPAPRIRARRYAPRTSERGWAISLKSALAVPNW